MFKAIKEDFPEREYMFHSGNLEAWFEREGIFLLNASLTVDEGKPSSHIEMWREFTNDVIRFIDNHNKKCVYLLLGKFAQSKAHLIQNGQMIYGIHPSPLAVNQGGFFDAHLFRKVESILGETINWSTE
jgi:uracil-DNA glycosylase